MHIDPSIHSFIYPFIHLSIYTHSRIYRCKNEGSFTFGAKQVLQSGMDVPWSVQAVDVDGDGDRDIVHTDTGRYACIYILAYIYFTHTHTLVHPRIRTYIHMPM